MAKKSFTIIELLVAVIILSMIFVVSFGLFNEIKLSQKLTMKTLDNMIDQELVVKMMYDDMSSADIKILKNSTQKLDILILNESKNSIYNRPVSWIKYQVDNGNLIRQESSNVKMRNSDNDILLKEVTIFKLFKGRNKNNIDDKLIFIKTKKDTIYFEVRKM
jgi:type II secretory pathway component PulJ